MDTDLSFNDYLAMVKRRWKVMLLSAIIVSIIAVVVAFTMSPIYESKGTILIESQQIPTELMKANVNQFADERIEAIKQRVMTRENLLKLIENYRLYADKRDKLSVTEMVDDVKNSINITTLSANKGGKGGTQATIAFSVNFENSRPDIAFKITNDIITLFLSENAKDRTTNATETTEFFEKEGLRLRDELEEIEKKVAVFKQQNAASLPEYKDMNLAMIQRLDTSLEDVDRDIKSSQEELRYLDIELTAAKAGIGTRPSEGISASQAELNKLKDELTKLSMVYSDNHPSLKKLKAQVKALEKAQEETTGAKDTQEPKEVIEAKLRVDKVEAQISSAKVRTASLNTQKQKMLAEMSSLQQQVLTSPQVERELTGLMRDYENAKTKYDEIKSKQINSKLTVTLEQENKGERFVLIDPPSLPEKPTKPDRKKIIALGVIASLAIALALMIALESLDKRIRTDEQLAAVLSFEPLAVIPYIKTYEEMENNRKASIVFAVGLLLVLIIGLVLIHFLYMPLDVLMVKINSKL